MEIERRGDAVIIFLRVSVSRPLRVIYLFLVTPLWARGPHGPEAGDFFYYVIRNLLTVLFKK
jgi:hypothetical protein